MGNGGFGLSYAAGGAADELRRIIQQKFLEMTQQQEHSRALQALEQAAARDRVAAELGRGRLANDARQITLGESELGEKRRQFDAGAPDREAERQYRGAMTGKLNREPQEAEADRAFTTKRDLTLHGYRMNQIGADEASQRRLISARAQAEAPKGQQPNVQADYVSERGTRLRDAVTALKGRINNATAGAGSLLANVPATSARDFRADLNYLKANVAFKELTEMRAASKTGGALGQVSDKELQLLESALGALDQGQSPANLRANLEKIEQSLARWEAAKGGGATPPADAQDPKGRVDALLKKYGG